MQLPYKENRDGTSWGRGGAFTPCIFYFQSYSLPTAWLFYSFKLAPYYKFSGTAPGKRNKIYSSFETYEIYIFKCFCIVPFV